MRKLLSVADSITVWAGRVGAVSAVAMVCVVSYGVFIRYVAHAPELWPYEMTIMLGGSVFIIGLSYAELKDAHVGVDIFTSRLSPRVVAIINVVCALLFLFPPVFFITYISIGWAWDAWVGGERMAFTGWYPPAWPLRTMFALGFFCLSLQGTARFVRRLHYVVRGESI